MGNRLAALHSHQAAQNCTADDTIAATAAVTARAVSAEESTIVVRHVVITRTACDRAQRRVSATEVKQNIFELGVAARGGIWGSR